MNIPFDRAVWFSKRDAALFANKYLPDYRVRVMYDRGGYWINVDWNNGIISYLTWHEEDQLKRMTKDGGKDCHGA